MVDKVVVFCDFNGVVNLPQGVLSSVGLADRAGFPVDSSVIVDAPCPDGVLRPTVVDFSSRLVSELNGFMSAAPVLWYWLSSWRESVSAVSTKMGLSFPSLNATWVEHGEGNLFKHKTVESFMFKNPDAPVIWIDDAAVNFDNAWWDGLSSVEPLLIKPETSVGLTGKDLDNMFAYVSRFVSTPVSA
jgi:hypothetical protein